MSTESKYDFEFSKICCLYGGFTNGSGANFDVNLKKQGDSNNLQFVPDYMIIKQIIYGADATAQHGNYVVYCTTLDAYCGTFQTELSNLGGVGDTDYFALTTNVELNIPINCKGNSVENLHFEVKHVGATGLVGSTDLSQNLMLMAQFVKLAEKKTLAEGSTAIKSGLSDQRAKTNRI